MKRKKMLSRRLEVEVLDALSIGVSLLRGDFGRELTKRHETAFQSTLEGAVAYYEANDPKGECVIVIAGRSREEIRQEEKARWEDMSIEDHMEHYISQGLDRKEAMKKVAKDRGVQKREIYNYLEKQKS